MYFDQSQRCLVTGCVYDGVPIFAHPEMADAAVRLLRDQAEAHPTSIYAHVIMPTHFHIVMSPPVIGISEFIGGWKSLTYRARRELGFKGTFWQNRFRVDFANDPETFRNFIHYTLNNPVKAKLASTWDRYRWSGHPALDRETVDGIMSTVRDYGLRPINPEYI